MKNNISCTILLQKVREARQPFQDVAPGEEVQNLYSHQHLFWRDFWRRYTQENLIFGSEVLCEAFFAKYPKMDQLAREENESIEYKIYRKITMLATKRKSRAFTCLTSQVSTVLTILPRRAGSTLLLVRWDSNLTKNERKEMSWFLFQGSTPPKWWMSTEALPSGFSHK